MNKNKHIKDFLNEFKSAVTDKSRELAIKYDIPEDDVLFLMTTGVYTSEGDQLLVGVTLTATNEIELEGLLDGTDSIIDQLFEDESPDTSSIDYWINLSNGDDSVN
tara:strand:- start:1923 stop:2240 length:318 start_codon:yes stop_codon:yes gene_type:complete